MKEIEKLYDLYSKDVYRFIYSLSFDEEIAKDIMQITFLECIKSIKNFKGNCSEPILYIFKETSENTINLWKQFRTDRGFYPKWFRRVQWGFKSNTFS